MKLLVLCVVACVVWVQGGAAENLCSAPILENGKVEAVGSSYPGVDTFTGKLRCNAGFALVGMSDTIKCRSGIWSVKPTNFPFCTAIGSCPDIPEIENGHKKSLRGFRNSVFKFRCNRGYRLFGAKKMYCTGSEWSSPRLPVCTKSGCDEELVSSVRHGGSRKMLGGGVYRFRCDRGSLMEGPQAIVCDGTNWNGTAPICLTAPAAPHLELQVEGSPSTSATVGQRVTLVCRNQGGSPVPALELSKNGDVIGDVEIGRNSFSFDMEESDRDSVFQCSASNRVSESPAKSPIVSLQQSYAPTEVIIFGEDIANRGDRVKFGCSSVSHPNPQITWTIIDQDDEVVDVDIEENGQGKSTAVFTVQESAKAYSVKCTASNGVGEVSDIKKVNIRYLPKSISMDGPFGPAPKSVSSESDSVFNCSSYSSNPAASISWTVDFGGDEGDLHDRTNTDNMLLLLEDGSWMTSSSLTVPAVGAAHPSFTIQCEAAVEGIDEKKVSEPHTVMVTHGATYVTIEGGSEADVNTEVSLTCKAGKSYPESKLEWTATDQNGQDVALVASLEETTSVGEVHSTAIMRVEEKHEYIDIECTAANAVTTISSQKSIKINSAPKSVSIAGTEMVETGEAAEYRCTTGWSSPAPTFTWQVTDYRGENIDMADLGVDGDEDNTWSRMSFVADRSQNVVKITCTASNQAGSVSHIQQVYIQYSPETLELIAPESTGASDESEVRCSSSPSVPAADIVWTVIINGQEVELDREETDQVNTPMEDGGVQTYSTVKLPALGTSLAVVKCRSVGTWANYQELVQEHTIVAKGPPGSPLITGLREGAEVPLSSKHVLTCSAEAGNPPATLRWFRGQEEVKDVDMQVHGGNVIATWNYVAMVGDRQLLCEASNDETQEPLVATLNIDVNKAEKVILEEDDDEEEVEEPQFNKQYETEKESQTPLKSNEKVDKETPSAPQSNPKGPVIKSKDSRKSVAEAKDFLRGSSSRQISSIPSLLIVLTISKLLL